MNEFLIQTILMHEYIEKSKTHDLNILGEWEVKKVDDEPVSEQIDWDRYDDWAHTECDYCHEYRKCWREDELPLNENGEPRYYCDGEDCKHLQYINGEEK